MKRYRVLREGIGQRKEPGGPIEPCEIGDTIEVGDDMAEFLLSDPDPCIEAVSARRRRREEE